MAYPPQKIEKILDMQQQLHQVKEEKVRQEQSTKFQPTQTLQQLKQAWQDAAHLRDAESFLNKTIGILLKPETAIDNHVSQELPRKQQQQKKKRGLHL